MGRLIVMVVALLGLAAVTQLSHREGAPVHETAKRNGRIAAENKAASVQDTNASSLTVAQRAKLAEYFSSHPASPVDTTGFAISIGAIVPASVALTTVPQDLADLIGGHRGDAYIKLADKLVVVAPETRKIVAVLPL